MNVLEDIKIKILSVPFTSFTLPSLEISLLTAYLKQKGFNVEACYPAYLYADFLGWEDYKYIRDNDYGQKIFSSLLFENRIEFMNEMVEKNRINNLRDKSEKFVLLYISNLSIDKKSIVIFHIYNKQLLASLYFAKEIKRIIGCKVWFTGFHCEGKLGDNLKEIFPFIDETMGINIEEKVISKLTNKDIEISKNLNFLPTPDYTDFYKLYLKIKDNIPAFKKNNVGYQVEYSRGCKWNKCSFCTLNCHSDTFREREIQLMLKDYETIADKYKTTLIYPEHFVMANQWEKWLLNISEFHKYSSNTINLNFKVKDLLCEDSFKVIKKARANILIGTESFSEKYLARLNKGQRVIENIQVLKFAKRWKVPCFHNLMYGLPYENEEMYMESESNIEYIYHLQPPFDIEKFRLTYGSDIYNNFGEYNIDRIYMKIENQCMFPEFIKEKYIPFFYDFDVKNKSMIDERRWVNLVEKWRNSYYKNERNSIPVVEQNLIKSNMGKVFQIIDRRYETQIVYNMSKIEWEVYLYIDNIRTKEEIESMFKFDGVHKIIENFHKNKLVFIEDDLIVALAI
ncbi:radical SAM protein [Fusobacterium necrophorum]|uniref:radical SAM protein n=1 Tax=Fusobacterium necrophorum TaxID=859 RepID=UPI000D134AB6|nr:radical SAM protein [Fusobacterium necrophorum]AVQ21583.1 hypothetical protein C4N15_07935 [Fusobacterium necrophorum subsp. funduliforme]MBR8722163.1 hypothetical protein [Fusobacterium necrophorum subsp. funduliforme]MDK4522225.1 radical SAM protein [Fusobacterium necrophorum]